MYSVAEPVIVVANRFPPMEGNVKQRAFLVHAQFFEGLMLSQLTVEGNVHMDSDLFSYDVLLTCL